MMFGTRQETALRGRVDWLMVASIAGLVACGTLAILSSASAVPNFGVLIQKHFLAAGLGILLFLFSLGFNYQVYQDQAKTLYVLTLLMMLGVLFFGSIQRGQRAWIHFPFFTFQPSEIARIFTILILANYLDRRGGRVQDVSTVFGAFALAAPIMALILKEPDFSSTLSFFPMLLVMLFCAGANLGALLVLAGYGSITLGLPLAWTLVAMNPEWQSFGPIAYFMSLTAFGWPLYIGFALIVFGGFFLWRLSVMARTQIHGLIFVVATLVASAGLGSAVLVNHQLKVYQRNRFVAFLVPQVDPRGAGYNVRQAQIAIGSGGLWGKGLFSGTQSQLGFLPERHTDFVFAVIGEEMGFLGAVGVLAFYLMLVWRIVNTARVARDRYGYLVCCGMASIYGFSLLVNVGMCVGMVPVAGIPLPLVSYGGSNLAVTLYALGITANIYSRRYAFL
ncbi:MAG: FtsW/RodA/SpoVE family cell cycle protein [Elusimicrobiota bacterium]|jgi:rod shape determining protein RodA